MRRILVWCAVTAAMASAQTPKGWTKGKGFGWVYGPKDEVERCRP